MSGLQPSPTSTTDRLPTATGDLPADAIGAALVDEHVHHAPQGHALLRPYLTAAAEDENPAGLAGAVRSLTDAGIDTILDTTTIECGRDVAMLRAASSATLNVMCCTGLSADEHGVGAAFRALAPVRLADVFLAELVDGIAGSGVRAAAIVLESSAAVTPFDETAALATAFAHAETGAPILLRAAPGELPGRVGWLMAHGVDPGRILALGCDSPQMSWATLDALGARGVRFGLTAIDDDGALDPSARAALLAYLIERFGDERVCLGTGGALTGPREVAAPAPLAPAGLDGLRQRAGALGIAGTHFDSLLRAGPRALFTDVQTGA